MDCYLMSMLFIKGNRAKNKKTKKAHQASTNNHLQKD